MKTVSLIILLLCVTLNAAVVCAADYHLVQSQIGDGSAPGVPLESLTVYVLVFPDQRIYVFKTFGSQPMREIIKHFPRGSVLHYDGNALMESPPQTEIQALTEFCKTKGIRLVTSSTS